MEKKLCRKKNVAPNKIENAEEERKTIYGFSMAHYYLTIIIFVLPFLLNKYKFSLHKEMRAKKKKSFKLLDLFM